MLKLAVLASTKATDMQAIIEAIASKKLNAEISILISNKKEAYALERAKNNNIPALFIDSKGKQVPIPRSKLPSSGPVWVRKQYVQAHKSGPHGTLD